ncbi:MAG: hypothetical protein NT049_03175 [Planctomycetota bacterium]|nr:hypothetical protein [Planctomycetota bacterium]
MTGKFKAEDVFVIPSRHLLAVSGNIIAGEIKVGMHILVPEFSRRLEITGVEFLQRVSGPCILALTFSAADRQEEQRWKSLDIKGRVVEASGD